MPHLFLVRHAEPAIHGVLLGRLDPPLSDYGRQQAVHCLQSTQLQDIASAAVYASPLRRARETAELAAPGRVTIIDDLAELSLGEWDGLSWEDIERRDPLLAARKLEDWLGVTPPGAEPWTAFAARVERALQQVLAGPLPAVLIAHLTVNSQLAHRLAGSDPISYTQQYCEVRAYDLPLGG